MNEMYRGADKPLHRPGTKQATAAEDGGWCICGNILRGKYDLLRQNLVLILLCSQQKLHEGVGDRKEDFAVTGWRLNA